MKREDVRPLLVQAVHGLPEPDLADPAWAAAVGIKRRRRRSTVAVLIAIVVIAAAGALIAGLTGGKAGIAPPTTPPSGPSDAVPPAGQIAGMDFWVAPAAGSERYLDHLDTPMGEALKLPDSAANLSRKPIKQIAAVVLANQNGSYEPLLLGSDGHWGQADLRLKGIGNGGPLSSGAVAPNGQLVAFPQSGAVVVLDATNGEVRRFSVPAQVLSSVSWLPDSNRLIASGPGAAYRVLIGNGGYGEAAVAQVEPSIDPQAATAPYRLDDTGGQVALSRYTADSGWAPSSVASLPVQAWVGQTFSTGTTAARLSVAGELPQLPNLRPQVVVALSAERSQPDRLLVLGASPPVTAGTLAPDVARPTGCCFVLGWYDDNTALIQVEGWVIAWSLRTGQVRRVTELEVSAVALGPGVRG